MPSAAEEQMACSIEAMMNGGTRASDEKLAFFFQGSCDWSPILSS